MDCVTLVPTSGEFTSDGLYVTGGDNMTSKTTMVLAERQCLAQEDASQSVRFKLGH